MIAILAYGLGNVAALLNVYKRLDIPAKPAIKSSDLDCVDHVILPGVGAFDYAMQRFNDSGLRPAVDNLIFNGNMPILGICVGMQMLARSSEEGRLPGLGYMDALVKRFDVRGLKGKPTLPHMGWNNIYLRKGGSLFKSIEDGGLFYFLHSYYFSCSDPEDILSETEYGSPFCSAAGHGNVFGVQFHPEKSHRNGMLLLKNFAEV